MIFVKVSVPSRGILFPNEIQITEYKLSGELFPSPLGASYFQICMWFCVWIVVIVSVPSRGILFPNAIL